MTPPLAPGEVALYAARPGRLGAPATIARLEAWCTQDERARIRRYRFEVDRIQHLVTRALVRASLARHRDVAPADWRFLDGAHGRPQVDPPCGLRFNATNTKTLVVCAVAESAEVGIDAEPRARAESILEVAPTVFSDSELAQLRAAEGDPEASRERALALWTLKEAYIKARGVGLGLALRKVTLDFMPGGAIALRTEAGVDPDPARWRFLRMDLDDHALAVAVDASAVPSVTFRPVEMLLED